MAQIILTAAAGFIFLVAFSLFFVWLDERSKTRAKQRMKSRFQQFDKYYTEMERESEKQEKKRKERMEVLGYANEIDKKSDNIGIAHLSGNAAV
jgi:hypothetical protein